MKNDRGLGFAVFISFIMFLACAPVIWWALRQQPDDLPGKSLLLCMTVPASAGCTVALLSGLLKHLFEGRRLSLWHVFLLPPMHIVVMALIVTLATTSSDSIQAVNAYGRQLLIWLHLPVLAWTYIAEIFFLGAALAIQNRLLLRKAR